MSGEQAKDVEWLGSTKRDMREFPEPVRRDLGFALYRTQLGERPSIAKTYAGPIQELRDNDDQNRTYRVVYIATFNEAVYVLHAFTKKATQGIATSQRDRDLIEQRFQEAKRLHSERTKQ